jgi:hypothetical protein
VRYRNLQQDCFRGRIIHENVKETFKIEKELGSGNYGTVTVISKRSLRH